MVAKELNYTHKGITLTLSGYSVQLNSTWIIIWAVFLCNYILTNAVSVWFATSADQQNNLISWQTFWRDERWAFLMKGWCGFKYKNEIHMVLKKIDCRHTLVCGRHYVLTKYVLTLQFHIQCYKLILPHHSSGLWIFYSQFSVVLK